MITLIYYITFLEASTLTMSSSKKRRLSLKTKNDSKQTIKPGNTILSMFKSQRQNAAPSISHSKQGLHADNTCIVVSESGSEEDPVNEPVDNCHLSNKTDTSDTDKVDSVEGDHVILIPKGKGDVKGADHAKVRKGKDSKPDKLGVGGSASDDEDFVCSPKTSKTVTSKKRSKHAAKSTQQTASKDLNVYRLRKRKTTPVVDSSCVELEAGNCKKKVKHDSGDDVTVIGETSSKYFTASTKDRHNRKTIKGLSLKKANTVGDSPRRRSSNDKSDKVIADLDDEINQPICDLGKRNKDLKLGRFKRSKKESSSKMHDVSGKDKKPIEKGKPSSNVKSKSKQDKNVILDIEDELVDSVKEGKTLITQISNVSGKLVPDCNERIQDGLKDKELGVVTVEDENNKHEDDVGTVHVENGEKIGVPYFLENFKTILSGVLEDKDYVKLFDDQDMKYIQAFYDLQGIYFKS